jgi:cysteine synthase A
MEIRSSITDCIGNTPIVYLDRFGQGTGARIAAKLEMFNPYSIKDRPVLYMIAEAEKRGEITKSTTIIEASSGNTAIALASICAMREYRLIICMSEIQSLERRKIIQAFGAELVLTPKEEGTLGARQKAKELHEDITDSYYICQHSNPDNILAHSETTAEELWRDTDGKIDVLVAGLGTTGTATGIAKIIKTRKPDFKVVGIEPENAPFLSKGIFNPHRMMGTAPGWVPDLYDETVVDEILLVSEEDAFSTCRRLAREEGILTGITSGATAHAALELASREVMRGKLLVCIFADSGERYLSVEGLY